MNKMPEIRSFNRGPNGPRACDADSRGPALRLNDVLRFACILIVASCTSPATADFQQSVRPLLEKHCIACHGPNKQEGDVRFDSLTGDLSAHPAEAEVWAAILEQLESRAMPPEEAKQPTADQRRAIVTWIHAHADEALELIERRMRFPENGNRVPHEKLFDPKTAEAAPEIAASPARFWRMLPRTYNKRQLAIRAWEHDQQVATAPFGLYVKHELKNYSSLYTLESSESEALANNARSILTFVTRPKVKFDQRKLQEVFLAEESKTAGKKLGHQDLVQDEALRTRYAAYLEEQKRFAEQLPDEPADTRGLIAKLAYQEETPGDEDLQAVVTEQYRVWLQRDPTEEELVSRVDYTRAKIKQFGNRQGLIYGLVPVLIHPDAVFDYEVGSSADRSRPSLLRPMELADALTRALDDEARGESQFHKLAREGKLQSREDVRAALTGPHSRPLSQANTVKRFFDEFFVYSHSFNVFKCQKDQEEQQKTNQHYFTGFRTWHGNNQLPYVHDEAGQLVDEILIEDRQVLKQLLTYTLLYPGSTEKAWRWRHERAITAKERDITRTEEALAKLRDENAPADKIAEAEAAVEKARNSGEYLGAKKNLAWLDNRDLPDRIGMLSTRAWLIAHSTNMDNHAIHRGKWIRERLLGQPIPELPIGVDAALPDAPEKTLREKMQKTRQAECWKCHRLMDPLGLPFERFDHFGSWRDEDKGKPVVSSGAIIDSGDPSIDGPVTDHEELLRKLTSSQRVEQSFVKHAFRFWMGRNETLDDARAIQDAWRAYHDHDGSVHHMLVSLLTSDAFLYRQGALPIDPEVSHAP